MKNLRRTILLTTVVFFIGCETGMSNKGTTDTNPSNKIESGIVTRGTPERYSKTSTPKASEIRKIFSNSGTPGYYVQVGYFVNKKPNREFINRMQYSQLPYTLLKKNKNGQDNYHALVGPYRSYNQAHKMIGSAKEFVSASAFIIKVVRP